MLQETTLGLLARSYMDKGEVVMDDIMIDIILEPIREPDCAAGVLFDGFPRMPKQACALTAVPVRSGRCCFWTCRAIC